MAYLAQGSEIEVGSRIRLTQKLVVEVIAVLDERIEAVGGVGTKYVDTDVKMPSGQVRRNFFHPDREYLFLEEGDEASNLDADGNEKDPNEELTIKMSGRAWVVFDMEAMQDGTMAWHAMSFKLQPRGRGHQLTVVGTRAQFGSLGAYFDSLYEQRNEGSEVYSYDDYYYAGECAKAITKEMNR